MGIVTIARFFLPVVPVCLAVLLARFVLGVASPLILLVSDAACRRWLASSLRQKARNGEGMVLLKWLDRVLLSIYGGVPLMVYVLLSVVFYLGLQVFIRF